MNFDNNFYFPKSDRIVVAFLLLFILLAAVLLWLAGGSKEVTSMTMEDSLSMQQQGYIGRKGGYRPRSEYYGQYAQPHAERFDFDPNTADSTQLLRLGLRPWMVRNIYKYRSRGGVFRQPEDFARVYGLTKSEFDELRPHIKITKNYAPAADYYAEKEAYQRDTVLYPVKLQPTESIPLSTADTTTWKRVPGIGTYFARQIVNYQQRLGGFYRKEQLLEIDGFPEEALQYVGTASAETQRMNINQLSLNQLKRHPYINFYQARAILDYRRLHGKIGSLDDLRLLKEFSAADIDRLRHYVAF